MEITKRTVPVDISTWLGKNCLELELGYEYYGSNDGLFYTWIPESAVPDKYFGVTMKNDVVYVTFYHPEPSPDSSWVDPIIEAYVKAAAARGHIIKGIEHDFRYNTREWSKHS